MEGICASKNKYSKNEYSLCGIINHRGSVLTSGHYLGYTLRDETWYEFDDSSVSQYSKDLVENVEAYVLFYIRTQSLQITNKINNLLKTSDFSSNSYVLVYRLWWIQFLNLTDPGPVDNSPLYCIHEKIHPRKTKILSQLLQPIPLDLWKQILDKYPTSEPVNCTIECGSCKVSCKYM